MILALMVLGPEALRPIARVRHPAMNEMSGIARSRQYPDTYWVHNDSGDTARIFPMTRKGLVQMPAAETTYWVNDPIPGKKEWPGIAIAGAKNIDWEDIAVDGKTLYLSDMGNNGNKRRDLGVYQVQEPDPLKANSVKATKFIPIAYPDQTAFPPEKPQFDCEAFFAIKGKLYFITKHRRDLKIGFPLDSAKLYRLDSTRTDKPNILTKLDQIGALGGWVTAASVSPDGRCLAVLCSLPFQSVWVFDAKAKGDKFLSGPKRKIPISGVNQAEGICFDDNKSVLITNEQREIFELKVGG